MSIIYIYIYIFHLLRQYTPTNGRVENNAVLWSEAGVELISLGGIMIPYTVLACFFMAGFSPQSVGGDGSSAC